MYQTCTEFGFFQTSTARPNLFSETFPVDFFIQQCVDVFGPRSALNTIMNLFLLRCRYIINALLYFNRYSIHLLNSAVDRSNEYFIWSIKLESYKRSICTRIS